MFPPRPHESFHWAHLSRFCSHPIAPLWRTEHPHVVLKEHPSARCHTLRVFCRSVTIFLIWLYQSPSHCWHKIPNTCSMTEKEFLLAHGFSPWLAVSKAKHHGRVAWWRKGLQPWEPGHREGSRGARHRKQPLGPTSSDLPPLIDLTAQQHVQARTHQWMRRAPSWSSRFQKPHFWTHETLRGAFEIKTITPPLCAPKAHVYLSIETISDSTQFNYIVEKFKPKVFS